MDKKIYLSIIAALATATAVWILALLVAPFADSLAWALVIGIATMPHHDRLVRAFPRHASRTAGIMVLIISLSLILPVTAIIVVIAQNAADWYQESEQLIIGLTETLPGTLGNFPIVDKIIDWGDRSGIDLGSHMAKIAATASEFLLNTATSAAKNLAYLFFTLAMALFILFFVYRDGDKIVSEGLNRFVTNKEKASRYLSKIRSAITAVIIGTILTCLVQGTLAGIGYFIADVPAPALCGALTAVTALIPVVGTAIIWVPLVVLLVIKGVYLKAGLLLLWCVVFVSLADNAIRPLTIGAKSNIPVPAIVLGAVGGITAMGVIGLILGPFFFTIVAATWHEAVQTAKRE